MKHSVIITDEELQLLQAGIRKTEETGDKIREILKRIAASLPPARIHRPTLLKALNHCQSCLSEHDYLNDPKWSTVNSLISIVKDNNIIHLSDTKPAQ